MNRTTKYEFVFILMVLCSMACLGCETMSAAKYSPPVLPVPTRATGALLDEVIDQIEWVSRGTAAAECPLHVLDIEFIEIQGRTIIEHWLVEYCDKEIKYKVRITPYKGGRGQVVVTYPGFEFK